MATHQKKPSLANANMPKTTTYTEVVKKPVDPNSPEGQYPNYYAIDSKLEADLLKSGKISDSPAFRHKQCPSCGRFPRSAASACPLCEHPFARKAKAETAPAPLSFSQVFKLAKAAQKFAANYESLDEAEEALDGLEKFVGLVGGFAKAKEALAMLRDEEVDEEDEDEE